ncbi:MAG TPA: membrane protein insertion efficiency factor YidD [bacterium]|nr:membrane protein insertion efficiency factor YidD [bacterium]
MIKKSFLSLIKIYQKILSPYTGGQCRFYPSCSEYAKQSIVKDGIIVGLLKSSWRILRCNPLNRGGIDRP